MFHKITIIGRLTRDVESKFTPSGTQLANFTLAIDDGWGDNKKTIWVRCTAWEKKAKVAGDYLRKGHQVHIEGRLNADDGGNPRVWQKNDGTSAASYEVTVDRLTLLDNRNKDNGGGQQDIGPGSLDEVEEIPF